MSHERIVIVAAQRTAVGAFQGSFANVSATDLGAASIKAALTQAGCKADAIDEVIMGCVLPAGLGQAPARQAAIAAGIPHQVGATTINKMCGSGMKSLMQAEDALKSGRANCIVAGGLESMTNAPYILPKARGGFRLGHQQAFDHMFFDGLEDAYEKGTLMGVFAERTAEKYQFTREQQDEFAITSLKRAQKAQAEGKFENEITPYTFATRKGETIVNEDDTPKQARLDKIPQLKPAFKKDGTVTPANSSSISDGSAALIVTTESFANANGLEPIAILHHSTTHSQAPEWFTTAPVGAIEKVLKQTGWQASDVDLFEINEAFAVVTMAAIHDLKLDHERVNIHGGACALGHPIGASGARIIVTLLNALKTHQLKKGVASLCIGGGEATALSLELV